MLHQDDEADERGVVGAAGGSIIYQQTRVEGRNLKAITQQCHYFITARQLSICLLNSFY